jgi:hypothetical protein
MLGAPLMLAAAQLSSLLTGLAAYWRLDGNATDLVGGTTGTLTGTGVSWGTGKIGQGAQVTQPGAIDTGVLPPVGAAARTLSFWFKVAGTQSANIIGYGTPAGFQQIDVLLLGAIIGVHWYGNSATEIAFAYATGVWNHYALTYSGTHLQAWLNGVPSIANPVALFTGPAVSLRFGGGSYFGYNGVFTGALDEVGVWNRVLTSTEIAALYGAGAGNAYPFG